MRAYSVSQDAETDVGKPCQAEVARSAVAMKTVAKQRSVLAGCPLHLVGVHEEARRDCHGSCVAKAAYRGQAVYWPGC